jgi:RNA polymerase sigma-70 factor (ECF subfamily)
MGSEADLLARCRLGEPGAWDELFDQHYAATGRFIFQLASDLTREDAEEICQEVFISVIKNLDSFAGQSQFQTWLFRIAANKARDFLEKRRAAKRGGGQVPISLQAADPQNGLTIDPPARELSPDMVLANNEQFTQVHHAVQQLGAPCREIIELRYFAELSYEEISLELQLNPKTVSSRLSKCLDKLEQIARQTNLRENSTQFPSNNQPVLNGKRTSN